MYTGPPDIVLFKSDAGALRNVTPKKTNLYVLTDFSDSCTLVPSSSHINFKWNSSGRANGIMSFINQPGMKEAQPREASNIRVILPQSSDLQRPK